MSFNVNQMVSALNKSGVARTSHIEVMITPPSFVDVEATRDMMFRVESVELPGRQIQSIEHRFTNYGPLNKVAYTTLYSDISITFILSSDLREKYFIEGWQNLMLDTDVFRGSNESAVKFDTKYFDDYVGTIDIRQFDETGAHRTTHKLVQAYPILINPISMGWSNSDEIARMTVQFAYRYYKVENVPVVPKAIKAVSDFTEKFTNAVVNETSVISSQVTRTSYSWRIGGSAIPQESTSTPTTSGPSLDW